MTSIQKDTQGLFARWGREGGRKRKRNLDAARRRQIASQAARTRWEGRRLDFHRESLRLHNPSLDDPVYLEEILADGELPEWRELYHHIANYPFGETAKALTTVVHSVEIYGATNLWRSLLKNLQGGTP